MLKRLVFNILLLTFLVGSDIALAKKEKNQAPPAFAETTTIALVPKTDQILSTGTLLSIPGIIVKPEIAGRITKIYFKSGDLVDKDTVLIEINPDIIKADLNSAQADFKLAKLNFDRSAALYKTHDISKADYDTNRAIVSSKANVEGAQAKLQQATVKAPFSGKLGLSQVNEGDYAKVGQDIVSLQTVDPLKVDFTIPEIYQSKIVLGQTVRLRTDAYPGQIFEGQVEAIESLINKNNRTLSVRANVPNPTGKLIAGGFVQVALVLGEQKLIIIPQTSVVYDPTGYYVYKVVNGKAEKTKVELGPKDSDNVIIARGLNPGEVVVTSGQLKLYPGAKVMVSNKKP